MKVGIDISAAEPGTPPGELGTLLEERGFESFWLSEHTHIPVSRESPYPLGGELPPSHLRMPDPFVALSAAGATTTRLRLGTAVCLLVQRDPITTAKATASLDAITAGRFAFGVGVGWNLEEMRNHGTDPRTRGVLLDERIEAIKQIWTHPEAEYHGSLVDFDPIWCWPKPVQRPHPPILIGGNSDHALARVVRHGDEWLPQRMPIEALRERLAELQRRAEDAGRDPIPATMFAAPVDVDHLCRLTEEGVGRVIWVVPNGSRDELEPRLDDCVRVMERVQALVGA